MEKKVKDEVKSKNGNDVDKIELTQKSESKVAEEGDEWEEYIPEPPDGGYGWVILVASFFTNFIVDGIAYCFGVFLQQYVDTLQTTLSSAGLANSLLCGVYLLVGPIVSALVNKFGMKAVGFVGSIIGAAAFIISTFSPTVLVLQLTYGVIGGIGFGMMYLPAVVGVGHYFEKKRAMATGIAVCGTGIGTFCMAPIGKLLLENFSWRSAHIILAGFLLQGCIFSALMRPLKGKRKKVSKPPPSKSMDTKTPDEEKLLGERSANGTQSHIRKRTTSRTTGSTSHVIGSRLVLSDNNTPASILHASAFLHPSGTDAPSSVDVHNLSKPLYRKDIFYSGSVMNVNHELKSQVSLKSYVASIASLPSSQGQGDRLPCLKYLPKPIADILAEMLDPKILTNKGMLVLCLANSIGMLGFYVPIVFSTNRALLLGVSDSNAALLLSIMGVCNTLGRVISGMSSFVPKIQPLLLNNVCITIAGVAVLLTPFCKTFASMAVAIACYGLFAATFNSLITVIMCDLVGLDKLTNGFGLLCLVRGITAIASSPIAGMLYDSTGSYDVTFYAGGGCILLSGILHFLLHLPAFKKKET